MLFHCKGRQYIHRCVDSTDADSSKTKKQLNTPEKPALLSVYSEKIRVMTLDKPVLG